MNMPEAQMDNPKLTEDPVILEIQSIRQKIHKQTQSLSSEELSRWYQEKAREVEERYYGTNPLLGPEEQKEP